LNRLPGEILFNSVDVQREILDVAFTKADAIAAEFLRHLILVLACQIEHFISHVDANHLAFRADELCRHVTDLASTAAEVEHSVASLHVA
jgi:hypothetical protein